MATIHSHPSVSRTARTMEGECFPLRDRSNRVIVPLRVFETNTLADRPRSSTAMPHGPFSRLALWRLARRLPFRSRIRTPPCWIVFGVPSVVGTYPAMTSPLFKTPNASVNPMPGGPW